MGVSILHCLTLSCLLWGATSTEPFETWVPEYQIERDADRETMPTTQGERLSAAELESLPAKTPTLPFAALTDAIRLEDGTLWVGSTGGLMRLAPGAQRWQLFHSRRWLPHDHVQSVVVDTSGNVHVSTPHGRGRLRRITTTLDEKMQTIHQALRAHHLRDGLVGAIQLTEPGRLEAGYVQHSDDNDGLWTALYVAAEAYRYAVTKDQEAKQNAWESLQALMFLEQITGIPGFAARSFVPIDQDPQPMYGGEWHRSADERWWWKGDTSSDEIDGHYFAYAVYYDLVADDEQKQPIRDVVARITDHILDHGYYYVGPSGKPTRWGVWAPEKLNHDLDWVDDRGLNSLEILSHLKVAEHIVGLSRYAEAARELNERHAYAMNTVEQKIIWPREADNHSDDELAFMAYYPLLWYERDPELRKFYLASLKRSWQIERLEGSPFLNYIYAAGLQANRWTDAAARPTEAFISPGRYDHQDCLRWFQQVPSDTFVWTVKNSHRQDLGELIINRFDQKRSLFVLPIAERPLMRWNGDPFELDHGAEGRRRDDGTFILLPYWMGRYHRFLGTD